MTTTPASADNASMATMTNLAIPQNDDTVASASTLSSDQETVFGSVLGLSPEMPLILPRMISNRVGWASCLLAALVIHLGVLAGINWPRPDRGVGAGGTDLEAVSIELVTATALHTTTASNRSEDAALARLDQRPGTESQPLAALETPDTKQQSKPDASTPAAALVIPDLLLQPEPPVPDTPTIVIAPVKAEQPVEQPALPIGAGLQPPQTIPEVQNRPSEAAAADTLGGATASGTSVVQSAAQSAAIASAGEISVYGSLVQRAVALNPPKIRRGSKITGDVKIEFALLLDGSLAYARVATTSGDLTLDNAALASVRTAKFPSPPLGSNPDQLKYTIPMKFR